MDVSPSNPYLHLAKYQLPPKPGQSEDPITIPEFEAPELSPEKRLELQKEMQRELEAKRAALEEERQAARDLTADYLANRSKKTQWEIYLSGLHGENFVDDAPSGVTFYNTLREIQRQNNLVKAYAAYGEHAKET